MNNENNIAEGIKSVITTMMDRVMYNVLQKDPFIKENHQASKPLYAALVPDEIFKGSHFERRFVTPFGGVWEKLTKVTADAFHGNCNLGYKVEGYVGTESLRRIQEVLNGLETSTKAKKKSKPNWIEELEYIKQGGGELIPVSVTCDIFFIDPRTNEKYAFELKAPLPNSDQTKVSKEKMFKLLAMEGNAVDYAFFALPYNPYGKKENYKWSFPMRWFNMHEDPSVLIGDEYWNIIGGEGTYDILIKEINSLGIEYKEQIYKDFLQIEPPIGIEENVLK